jgi:hypothetical protein
MHSEDVWIAVGLDIHPERFEKLDTKNHDITMTSHSVVKAERTLGRMRPKFRPPSVPVGIH